MSTRSLAAWALAAALSLVACGGDGARDAAPDAPADSVAEAVPVPAPAAAETAAVVGPPPPATPGQARGYERCLADARREAKSPDEATVLARRCASLPGAPR